MIWNVVSSPVEFPKVRLHVFSIKLDGTYRIKIKNNGFLPVLRGEDTEKVRSVDANIDMFDVKLTFSFLMGGEERYIEAKWEKKGVINVLKTLFNIMVYGWIKIHVKSNISGLLLSNVFETDATVSVKDIKIAWD